MEPTDPPEEDKIQDPNQRGFFQHQKALVESFRVGARTRVWAFAHILPGAVIGVDCNICDHVFIENDVEIGDRVTVKCGVQLWDGVVLEDDVFVGPNATFTNDRLPRSRERPAEFPRTVVRAGATIGANATILPGLTIGKRAIVGAGSVVTHDVPADAIVVGNPAFIQGYVNSKRAVDSFERVLDPMAPSAVSLRGVTVHQLGFFSDLRGSLAVSELAEHLPFRPQRLFSVFDVPTREARGAHAHRRLHQFLICVKGEFSLVVDDGSHRQELLIDSPRIGIHVEPMVWTVQYKFSADAVLVVLASEPYDSSDYIRDYDEYLELLSREMRDDDGTGCRRAQPKPDQ